jgi:hypothetical protein
MQEVRENFLPIKENWTTNKYPPVKPGALTRSSKSKTLLAVIPAQERHPRLRSGT